jgi:hypothetical protein
VPKTAEFGSKKNAEFGFLERTHCDIPRVQATDLKRYLVSEGAIHLADLSHSIIVEGVMDSWDSEARRTFTKEHLKQQYGNFTIEIRQSKKWVNAGSGLTEETLRNFIERTMEGGHTSQSSKHAQEPFYVFDKNQLWSEKFPELAKQIKLPVEVASGDTFCGYPFECIGNRYWSIGPAGAGTHFHYHPSAWYLHTQGTKLFMLYDRWGEWCQVQ